MKRTVPNTRPWGIALALATAVISGVAVFVNGYAVKRLPDATVYATAKNGIAAVVVLALLLPRLRTSGGAAHVLPRTRPMWAAVAAVGLVGGSVPFVLFFEGLARASSTQASFIHKTLVVWVALLAVPLLRERLTMLHVGAVGLLLAGQAVLVGDLGSLEVGTGEAMIAAATLLWAVEVVVAKRLLGSVGSLTLGASRMGVGLVALLAWVAATGRADDLVGLSGEQWRWAAVTGLLLSAYVATWFAALSRAQAVDVTAVLVCGALITAILDRGFNGTPLPAAAGLSLLLVGGVVAAVAGSRGRRVEAAV